MFKETGGWMHGRWPYRPCPQDDETLSSFMTRVAHGLGITPVRLISVVWGSKRPLLFQDLDNYAPPHVAERISEGIGISLDRVASMTFADYEGLIFATHQPKARKPWILPVSIASNERGRAGLQFCPICLVQDKVPHFRRTWRLAFATACTRHNVLLRDRCPSCDAVIHLHRAPSPRRCYQCGGDLASSAPIAATADATAFQGAIERSLVEGRASFAGRDIHARLNFAIVRQVASLVANGKRSKIFRDALTRLRGGNDSPFEKGDPRHPLEYLEVADRVRVFDLVRRALEDMPQGFIAVCREAGFGRSQIIKDMPYVPFAFDTILREHLDYTPYFTSDEEVASVAAWLRRTKGQATYRDLKAHCGESRIAVYKHMDYQRRQVAVSRWRTAAMSL